MVFDLKDIVPWGRSFEEHVNMFHLTDDDLKLRILGCSDGPASFNAQMNKQGYKVISIDPLYQFGAEEIENRIQETHREVIEQTEKNKQSFLWNLIPSVEELGRLRMSAMRDFLQDFKEGRKSGRRE